MSFSLPLYALPSLQSLSTFLSLPLSLFSSFEDSTNITGFGYHLKVGGICFKIVISDLFDSFGEFNLKLLPYIYSQYFCKNFHQSFYDSIIIVFECIYIFVSNEVSSFFFIFRLNFHLPLLMMPMKTMRRIITVNSNRNKKISFTDSDVVGA